MAEPHPSEGSSTSNDASAERSESIVELNIKTLDSQMYSFRVDKNIPVSVFKENIASKIGVPVGQQRLIFRGKVLKDSHLLSEYHVDNGHTLHLVARQPSQPQSSSSTNAGETTTGQDASAGLPRTRGGQVSHSAVLGTFNGGEQGESTVPDLSRVIGAVLNSFGIGNHTAINGSGGVQPTMQAPQGNEAEGRQGTAGDQFQAGNQTLFGQAFLSQSMPQVMQIPLGTAIPIPSLNQPIPDSLHTLSEFMNRMELSLSQNGNQPNQSLNDVGNLTPADLPANSRGMPMPEALSVVLRHAQRLLGGHAIDALSRIAGRVEQEGRSAEPTIRSQIQTESMQVGIVMQHLGALLLELGRTMLTLRMGQSSAESSVNAGPAVYISPLGPNPLMVQPFPLQTSSFFGGSVVPPLNPGTFVPGGVGPIPRHVNIHIHTAVGPRATNGEGMQGDRVNGTGSADSGQTHVLPVRNIIAAAVLSRPSVVSVSSAAQRGGSLSQPPPNSVPLSTVMAEVSSQIRSFVNNMRSENQDSSGHPESSVIQDQPTVSGAGNGDGNDDISLLDTIRETSLPSPGCASETESLLAQAESHKPCNKEDTEGAVNPDVPSSSSVKEADNQSIGETLQKPVDGTGCAPRSNQEADNPKVVTTVPLGLGLGGLQPKRQIRQSDLQGMGGDGATFNSPTNQNQHVRSHRLVNRRNASTVASGQFTPVVGGGVENIPMEGLVAGDQIDPANVMSQVLHSPALDGLLAGVSQQTGIGSPDVLRNMLGQLTQSPAMLNTVNQIAQQIDSQDFGSMFAGLGSGRSGGLDLSRMVQQMMPIVSQALGSASTIPQQASAVEREVQPTYNERRPSRDEKPNDQNSQIDLQQVVQSLEHEGPPKEVLRSVVESVIGSHDYGCGAEALVNELSAEDGLACEFMLVIVYERHDNMKAVNVCESSVLQNRFGVFKHSDWIGKPFGSKVFSNKGGFVYLLAPTPELWTLVLSHRTQILYIADISFVIMYLEIVPGCLVLESGTGSGSLTTSLARAVAPTGHVYTFDFHEQRASSAREDFRKTGLSSLVTVGVRDIQGEGFPDNFTGIADSVFLDLPQPWLAIPSVGKMLKQDGILCSFSPCIEQVQRSCETLGSNFTDIRTFEVLLRTYEVREVKMESCQGDEGDSVGSLPCKRRQRLDEGSDGQEISSSPVVMARPSSEARGHTGYLTFARLKCVS